MNLWEFKTSLAQNPEANLAMVLPGGNQLPDHFHITEVGRTEKRFVDCGGKSRQVAFASLQVWMADDTDHRLPARKLAAIIDKAQSVLGTDDLEMQVECQQETIGLFSVEGFEVKEGTLAFTLATKQTACLAMEVCLPGAKEEDDSCGTGASCCG